MSPEQAEQQQQQLPLRALVAAAGGCHLVTLMQWHCCRSLPAAQLCVLPAGPGLQLLLLVLHLC
jgi:hypothetical protein